MRFDYQQHILYWDRGRPARKRFPRWQLATGVKPGVNEKEKGTGGVACPLGQEEMDR